jgi:hypothetical membrane protein
MVRAFRWLFAILAWLFLGGLVIQVFFAGVGIFGDRSALATHAEFGWILHLAPILVLLVAAVGRAGRDALLWTAVLVVATFILPILATVRADSPDVAALHPVAALLVFWLSVTVALKALSVAREPPDGGTAAAAAESS